MSGGQQILRISQALEKQLVKKTYNLSTSFVKEFNNRSGFVPFENQDASLRGCALIDHHVEPPIRIVSYDTQIFDHSYIKRSIDDALSYRQQLSKNGLLDISKNAAYRLINETGDGLPGLAVDVFGDYIQMTTHTEHWCNYLNYIGDYIMKEMGLKGAYWKAKFKHKQSFAKHYMGERVGYDSQGVSELRVEENGMKVIIDLEDVISTGLFMDQRDNRKYLATLFKERPSGTILNTFAHTSTFSLLPSLLCRNISTYNIDTSPKYLNIAKKNFEINGLNPDKHRFVEKDVFGRLEELPHKSLNFDVIVLDPPTLARGPKFGVFTTKNRYRDLLDLAIPCLKKGGFIVSFVNTRLLKEDSWLRQLGVVDHMADQQQQQQQQVNKNKESLSSSIAEEEEEDLNLLQEYKDLNIKEAKFSAASKMNGNDLNRYNHWNNHQILDSNLVMNVLVNISKELY
ncbi:hypothetical protein DFA_11831 [Cavenderia fasciculata]|uniref:S-adenosylmethionine-dependent methyltransferase domain-containing protein n=1 Tax=Cavenderia fasciculata TaxID=261658 RepID=F4QEC1_CACFS|nr:uncharacterized protein DFA_11831 [Cavenderia fasciculata]EGG14068.1 hypothetical protein DFA_11831 [Cavenderia fasciculata]|eukprot:XP_004350776.1 hypothetical protein DFA_11831 [Cavenderia fasciculata]